MGRRLRTALGLHVSRETSGDIRSSCSSQDSRLFVIKCLVDISIRAEYGEYPSFRQILGGRYPACAMTCEVVEDAAYRYCWRHLKEGDGRRESEREEWRCCWKVLLEGVVERAVERDGGKGW